MKNNVIFNAWRGVYLTAIGLILALPILTTQPWFFPPDWSKVIIFRSIIALLLGLFLYQWLYRPAEITTPAIKENKVFWLLSGLFLAFLIATIFSVDVRFSLWGSPARGGGFINFTSYILFSLLTFLIIKKSDWQKLWIFEIFIGILVSLVAICQFYGFFNTIFVTFIGGPPSTLGNSTFLAIYLLLLFFRVIFFIIKKPFTLGFNQENAIKIAGLFVLLLFSWVILITGSRAGYLGLLIGATYFIFFYPKKLLILKITAGVLLLMAFFLVYFANTHPVTPTFVAQNKILNAVYPRLNVKLFLNDARFSGWRIGFKAFKEKPLLGWGPENFSIGFDKNYDPSLPYVSSIVSDWWDRGHNILIDIGVQTGILGITAYLALLIGLFWQLQKIRRTGAENTTLNQETSIDAHLLQTALIAYFSANLFSFDSFATYLIFFLIIGYSMNLIQSNLPDKPDQIIKNHNKINFFRKWKKPTIICAGITLAIFIWQYNIWPFKINGNVNKAQLLVADQQCQKAFKIMEDSMKDHSILDARIRMQYVQQMNFCSTNNPENNLTYAVRGIEIMKEAVVLQPQFSRLWIFLGGFTNVKANAEKDPVKKNALIIEANEYLQKARKLAPDHQELITEQIRTDMVAQNYQGMAKNAQRCTDIYPQVGICYFLRAISKIYLGDALGAKQDLDTAKSNNFDIESTSALNQLVTTYSDTAQYQKLVETYIQLIARKPKVANYHASIAFAYSQIGQYKKARQEALIFLEMMPEAKSEVDAFLKTLPY